MDKSFDLSRLLKNHKKHKAKPMQFVSVASGVQKRLETNIKNRKSSRLTVFDNLRNLTNVGSPARVSDKKSKEEHRRLQLEKWKEEKEKKKREAATQKKKPFLVGVAPSKIVPPPPPPKPMPSTSGRVTRSQSNKTAIKPKAEPKQVTLSTSFAPRHASFQAPQIKNLTVLPKLAPLTKKKDNIVYKFEPVVPNTQKQNTRLTRSKTSSNTVQPRIMRVTAKDIESKSKGRNPKIAKVLSPKSPVPKSESSFEEKLRSPVDMPRTPEQIADEAKKSLSPCVTMSRGKDNARKEMKKKIDEGLLDEDTSDMDSVIHFRRQLHSEIKRMTEMCEIWEKIQEQTPLSESIQELVLSAVGQARLLMSQKLAQFGSLVERCARPDSSNALVTPADLAGFWDMVFMQVENIDMRFKKLEELKSRGWVEDKPVEVKKKVTKINDKKPNKFSTGPSRLREMIAAARKAKVEANTLECSKLATPVRESTESTESKTFEAGFFSVRSPVRSPAPSPRVTPAKPTLLKAVLSSEAKKSASKNTSFAMLRASLLSRNIEHDGIALLPQTPVNLNATPGRSILKSASISEKKSSKKVLFDDSDNDIKENSDSTEEPFIGFKTLNGSDNIDSGVSSMDVEKENKEGSRRKSKLSRQDAITDDRSPVMTRSRRKSMNTPKDVSENCAREKTPKRSTRKKKTLQENISNNELTETETPKRSTARRSRGMKNIET